MGIIDARRSPSSAGGSSEIIQKTYEATETISAIKAVTAVNASDVKNATNDNTCEDATVLGISLNAATAGNLVNVRLEGQIEDASLTFAINEALYLGMNGMITNVAPTTGFRTKIGHGLGPGAIYVRIEEPIELS